MRKLFEDKENLHDSTGLTYEIRRVYTDFVQKHKRSWTLGEKVVEEEDQYKNLGVVKNYAGSFQFDIDEAIAKTRENAGMILNGCTDRKKQTQQFTSSCGSRCVCHLYYSNLNFGSLASPN